MPKAYRKPHISINRKKYGNKVKVVKKSKAQPKFDKPSATELKSIYSRLKNCPDWERLDIYALAIQWYRKVIQYAHNISYVKKPSTGYSKHVAIKIQEFFTLAKNVESFGLALSTGQVIAKAYGIKTVSPVSFLKEGKSIAKKLAKKEEESTEKYSKILKILSSATGNRVEMKVSPTLGKEKNSFDHLVNTLYYSPSEIKRIKKQLYQEGLLSVVLQQAWIVARSEAFTIKVHDEFIVDAAIQGTKYRQILYDFEEWVRTNKEAPRTIVRKLKEKKDKIAAS